jgi:hypothetical protein
MLAAKHAQANQKRTPVEKEGFCMGAILHHAIFLSQYEI